MLTVGVIGIGNAGSQVAVLAKQKNMENEDIIQVVTDCKKGAKTVNEIPTVFDGEEDCASCPHIKYKNGTLSCDYAKV